MRIFLGLELGGSTLTAFDDLEPDRGSLGRVVWGPGELLRDLEVRLGLGAEVAPSAVRTAAWAERMHRLSALGRFYSSSFAVDPLGTARAVLELRDELVLSGWNGEAFPTGAARLDALCELEVQRPMLPPGIGDRLLAVCGGLQTRPARLYHSLTLAEPQQLWSSRWQSVFGLLERSGTQFSADQCDLGGAAPDTDLGRVQASVRGVVDASPLQLQGDGTFLILTAPTSWEAARATAAILAGETQRTAVVVRGEDAALDHALEAHGLVTQGVAARSAWRGAVQVLPLALDLAFDPKDPVRMFELLTLPTGPFEGKAGYRLTRALVQSPGIGNSAWEHAKRDLASDALDRVAGWLESPGADPIAGAGKAELVAVIDRVRAWIVGRIAATPDDTTLLSAVVHCSALHAALEVDPRERLNLVEVRRLVESVVASGSVAALLPERSGRLDHVSTPGALRVSRESVIWWSFVDAGHSRTALPWRARERAALSGAGVRLIDPRARLAARAEDWRRVVLSATRRVVLVVPESARGKTLSQHPLWDEIAARTRITAASLARIAVRASDMLLAHRPLPIVRPAHQVLSIRSLPGGHTEWRLRGAARPALTQLSATSLAVLLGCPLRWTLQYGAAIRSGGHALPRAHQLNGSLGHRLIERLVEVQAFEGEQELGFVAHAEAELDELIRREGALLLRPGMGFERDQLRRQLVHAVRELYRMMRSSGLRVVAVEQKVSAAWGKKALEGRIDVLVASDDGSEGIIDVKWGYSSYRKRLGSGSALQLATYAFVYASQSGREVPPSVAYFSLSRGRLLAPTSPLWPDAESVGSLELEETWRRVERTLAQVEGQIANGRLHVTGLRRSLPLLEACEVDEADRPGHFTLSASEACEYCEFGSLCGRRWEAVS